MTSLGQQCNIVTRTCPLHLTIETPWGIVRFTMPFIVLPGRGDVVVIGQKTLREKLGIDVMAQLEASVFQARGREDGAEMKSTAGAEPKTDTWSRNRQQPRLTVGLRFPSPESRQWLGKHTRQKKMPSALMKSRTTRSRTSSRTGASSTISYLN